MKQSKQVIVMRSDLKNSQGQKVRTGKLISQGAHASILAYKLADRNEAAFIDWDTNCFTKITLKVNSEEELKEIFNQAVTANLNVAPIIDNGTTEFGMVHTFTCLAIGPHWADDIDKVTGNLSTF